MPRLREVPRDQVDKDLLPLYDALFGPDRDPVEEPGTATGTPGNWWTVFALVPDCMKHAVDGFKFYRGRNRFISAELRELGQARAGFARGSQFVFSQHCKALRACGFSVELFAALPHWGGTELFSDIERAVLAYTVDLVLGGGRISDAVFSILKDHLSYEAILELTYITCMYEMHATMTRALRLEFDDVDERITEVPLPDGEKKDIDFMRVIERQD
ncbi:MAG: carboxymuconolactone decarboxylase family protein [Pirellulales bacterium]|nr:carboxymuconolactone decarboxylase family protein [Pirellulales bacterium]